MLIAILSDIHGNSIALDAVLGDIRSQGGVDEYWILGDLVAIGHDPIAVLDRLSRLPGARIIRGNTDRYVITGELPGPDAEEVRADPRRLPQMVQVARSFAWTQGAVAAAGRRDWLAALPSELRVTLPDGTRALAVHATPRSDDEEGLHPAQQAESLRRLFLGHDADLVFAGHTHTVTDVRVDGARLVNPGSVSNPFPPDLRASYLLLHAGRDGFQLQPRRVDYDREAVIAAVQQLGHPAASYIIRYMRGQNRPSWSA